jgi:hypothetical protein
MCANHYKNKDTGSMDEEVDGDDEDDKMSVRFRHPIFLERGNRQQVVEIVGRCDRSNLGPGVGHQASEEISEHQSGAGQALRPRECSLLDLQQTPQ